MTLSYKYLQPRFPGVAAGMLVRSVDGAFIPCDSRNKDFQAYLQGVKDGVVIAPPGAPVE